MGKRKSRIITGIVIFFIFFLLLLIFAGQNSEKKEAPVSLSPEDLKIKTTLENFGLEKKQKQSLACFYKGNFTNSGKNEIVAFYRNEKKDDGYIKNDGYIVILNREYRIEKIYGFESFSLYYDGKLNDFAVNQKKLGREIDPGYIGDINNNGKEELYLHKVEGAEEFWPVIYEFFDGRMKCVFNGKNINYNLGKEIYIKDADKEKKEIIFYDFFKEKDYTYVWSDKERRYIPKKSRNMIDAVCDNDIKRIKELLNSGTDINRQYDKGFTALHEAAYRDNVDIINFLLDNGAELEIKDDSGNTPLITATLSDIGGTWRVIEPFLSRGADMNTKNNAGDSALEIVKRGITRDGSSNNSKYNFFKEYMEKQ